MIWTANPVFSDYKIAPTIRAEVLYVDHFFGEIRSYRTRKPMVVGDVTSLYKHCITPPPNPSPEPTSPVHQTHQKASK